ncbi:MAG: hypothetical protein LBJ01_05810 [Tannerella sp.]|jgi:hypothetical protein|nr:hypothetical protein [Tannerella sp.]
MIRENAARNRARKAPYDPVTGEGCQGERVRLEIADAPAPVLCLPVPMMCEEAAGELSRYGSIRALFKAHGEKLTEAVFEDFWIRFCELRYRYDFEYFAYTMVLIRDKITSRDIPFLPNRGQRRLIDHLERMRLAGDPIRLMLLKARQWGGSTCIQIYMLWIQLIHRRNWNSVVCAHTRDSAITIRSMYDRAVGSMLPVEGIKHTVRVYAGTQNIREVPGRGCLITVGSAESPDSVRSQDVKMAHFSEVALYPNTDTNKTEGLEAAVVGTVPAEPCTLVIRESTARGVGDYFHEEWEKAVNGETAYDAVFVPWFLIDTYRKEFDGRYWLHGGRRREGTAEDFVKSMNEYEQNLFRNCPDCTLEALNWRRLKRAEMTGEAMMKQEFPSDAIEAFQDSGRPAFRSEDVEAMRRHCRVPRAAGILAAAGLPASARLAPRRRKEILADIRFIDDPEALERLQSSIPAVRERGMRDKLCIWEFPDTQTAVSNRYLVVFDPQKGLSESADWGVIAVFDRYWMQFGGKPEIVAQWRGRIDKDLAVWVAAQIAAWYGRALLVVESNTYDSASREDDAEFIFDTVADCYPNLYSRTPADKIREGIPAVYGFHTNRNTKPMILNNYVALLREQAYIERSGGALDEARVYEQKENGAFGAKKGKHDDILMSRMIGLHICYNEMPLPANLASRPKRRPAKPSGESSI